MIVRTRRSLLLLSLVLVGGALAGCGSSDGLPPVLYLRPDPTGRIQLYRQDTAEAAPQQLGGQGAGDVLDFAAAPDGRRLVYTITDGANGALRIVNSLSLIHISEPTRPY